MGRGRAGSDASGLEGGRSGEGTLASDDGAYSRKVHAGLPGTVHRRLAESGEDNPRSVGAHLRQGDLGVLGGRRGVAAAARRGAAARPGRGGGGGGLRNRPSPRRR